MCSPVADKVSTASKARFHLHVATMRQSFLLQTTLHGNKTKKHPFNFFINCHNVSPSFFIFLDCFGWKWCGLSETMESVLNPHHLVTFTLLWIRSGQIEMSDFRKTLKTNSLFSNIFLFQCLSLKVISSG